MTKELSFEQAIYNKVEIVDRRALFLTIISKQKLNIIICLNSVLLILCVYGIFFK